VRKFISILCVIFLAGCSTYQFTGPKNITIQPGVPSTYTNEEVTRITVYTVDEWVKKYGKPKDYDALQNLSAEIDSKPVRGNNYGVSDFHGAPYIIVWAHSNDPVDSAITHEMIHILQGLATGDDDRAHSGSYWGEGFESPVKRGLAK